MDQLVALLCSCIKDAVMEDADGDGIPDIFQKGDFAGGFGKFGNGGSLNDALLKNLLSLRGRRNNIRNIPINIVPTKFEDDIDSIDEDGEEVPVLKEGVFAGQHFDYIQQKCLETNQLFVDPMFPPCESSLYVSKSSHGIEWKRASELAAEPRFFVGGGSRFDINQGELGDCWLLAAIANLTMHEKLFETVVPHDQDFDDAYAGIFHFRFWQYGEWIDVVIDDFLPTRNGRLLFMSSDDPDEFWSALLEKAYAKLHGSYEALRGGTTTEALVDFSGGCTEHYDLKQTELSPTAIFKLMLKAHSKDSMMACSMEADPRVTEARTSVGLIRGHAYSITKVLEAPIDTGRKQGLYPLIRIRNPWGNEAEWKGAWSDHSEEWQFISDEDKEAHGIVFENDGEFFMSMEDFFKYFDSLEVCNLTPDCVDEDHIRWHESHFNGTWLCGSSAGGCRNFIDTFATNPQFLFRLTDSDDDSDDLCTCVIALMQKGSRKRKVLSNCDGCLSIGFAVYQLESEDQLPLGKDFFRYNASCARSPTFINLREVVARFKLHPGLYVVIPSTFEPEEESDFLLRIFSEKDSECYQA